MYRPGRIRSDRWRDIALLCQTKPLTVPAIARAMGVEPGSIQSLVTSMRRENLLDEASIDTHGLALKLTRHGKTELKKHEDVGGVDALLQPGERLVFVIDEGHGISAEALAALASDPSFRWAARIDGTVKWIASLGSGAAIAADRAVNTLASDGARAVVGKSDAFFDAEGLTRYADQLRGTTAPALRRG